MTKINTKPEAAGADLHALQLSLQREVNSRIAVNARDEGARPQAFLVCDFEYLFRRDAHDAWCYVRGAECDDRGSVKVPKMKWPFHTIAAVSWMIMQFDGHSAIPHIEPPVVMTLADHDEIDILRALFAALDALGETGRMVTWGGEVRDLAVLRFQACRHGLPMPLHLHDTSPYARERIDLCRAVTVQADPVHLDEYAAGAGIPSKPSPAKEIGKLVEAGEFDLVHDHVLADVLTTSIIAMRWLAAKGEVACDRGQGAARVFDAAAAAFPDSKFLTCNFGPWARDELRRSRLAGRVYHIEEIA